MSNHLLISELIPFGDLNHTIKDQNTAIALRIEEKNVLPITTLPAHSYLILRLFVVKNFLHLQTETLAYFNNLTTKLTFPHRLVLVKPSVFNAHPALTS